MKIDRRFFRQETLEVAKQLLGTKIVRQQGEITLSAMIVETEAYVGPNDSACHAAKGKTQRTQIMFGEAGHAYIYFVYGMHYMFNIVTESVNFPAAVLIRAAEPLEGIQHMIRHRKNQHKNLCNGPARLCQALAIDKALNGIDLTTNDKLWIEHHQAIKPTEIIRTTRIGIDYAEEKDRNAKWRFYLKNNSHISKL